MHKRQYLLKFHIGDVDILKSLHASQEANLFLKVDEEIIPRLVHLHHNVSVRLCLEKDKPNCT
jgi:hypothetical protein